MRAIGEAREGDRVRRLLSGTIPMDLTVTRLHEGLLFCGPWTFDLETGIEEDPELGWGREFGVTGSVLEGVLEPGDTSAQELLGRADMGTIGEAAPSSTGGDR